MTTPHTSPNRDRVTGPGALLAQARQDLHLGLEEVAGKLHLSMRQIESLEQDDYQSLPGATYVRGYLKSYAMLLGIDPGPVLDAHAQITAKRATPPDLSAIAPQREITSRHHQIRIVTYLVAIIVVGLAIAWWQGRSEIPTSPLAVTPTAEPAAPGEPPADASGVTPSADDTRPATPLASEDKTKPEPPASAPVASAPVAATPAVRTPDAITPLEPATTAPLPAGPRGTLVVYAEQDTWVDVRDSRQVRLLYETVTAGRTVTLEGVAPIHVFLGNAAGARVEYNGRPVDVGRYQRGMVARFIMGEDEASVASPQ